MISWVGEQEGRRRGAGGEKLNSVRDAEDVRREIELIPWVEFPVEDANVLLATRPLKSSCN